MKVLFAIAPFVAVLLWYIMSGREWLKKQSWAQGFFRLVEPIEIALFKKSETMLMSRLLWVGSLFVTFYDSIATFATGLNWTPVTTRALANVPEDLRSFIVTGGIGLLGLLMGWLRKRTTKPLEVVAVAEKDITPKVAEAMAVAEIAKVEAVKQVAAEEAKAA